MKSWKHILRHCAQVQEELILARDPGSVTLMEDKEGNLVETWKRGRSKKAVVVYLVGKKR
jgi:hypothetical protein